MTIETRKLIDGTKTYKVIVWKNGQRIARANFTKRADAVEWERKQKTKIVEERHLPDRFVAMKMTELFKTWLNTHAKTKKAPSSILRDEQVFRDYIDPFLGKLNIHEISPTDLDHMINSIKRETALKNTSINRMLELVRSLFTFAVKRRFIPYSPMSAIDMLPVQEQPFDFWSNDEASKFLSDANVKYQGDHRWVYVAYLAFLTTGMRLGELFSLSWTKIMFDQNLIMVSATWDNALRKVKEETKGKKIRYTPLDSALKAELMALRSRAESNYIFLNSEGNKFDHDNFRKRRFHKDCDSSNLRRIRIHDLRHTFASHYMMNGGNLHDLQIILGHSDVKLTMRYAHLAPEHIASKAGIVSFSSDNHLHNKNVIDFTEKEGVDQKRKVVK